jgi:hypothetical protein
MADEPQSVGDVLDKLKELSDEGNVEIGHLLQAFGSRAYGPFLVIVPLVDISPVGGIPGLPTAMALVVFFIAVQMVLGRKHLWLPGFVTRRKLPADKVRKVSEKTRGLARFLDRWFHGRLPRLTSGPFVRIAGLAVMLLTLAVPPLELLPFATTAPMVAILAFGLALLVRDGVLMIIAFILAAAAAAIGVGLMGSSGGGKSS